MPASAPEWLAPTSLEEALELRARFGEDAIVVAGGTFVGILLNQRLIAPPAFLALQHVSELVFIESSVQHNDALLRIGALTAHRAVEHSVSVHEQWPVLTHMFSLVASPRVRNQATVGGVLADADYASDPPALFYALDAHVIARSLHGEREISIEDLITGYYETSLRPDELLTEVRIVQPVERAIYRKFRSRSSEDRPCVAVAAARVRGKLRVVVGAVAERPQYFPALCALADHEALTTELATEIGQRYAEAVHPISDARGSAAYRRRVIAVEVRRALQDLQGVPS